MPRQFPELDRLRVEISPATRLAHLDAIRAELRTATPTRRRWKLMVVAVAILLTLPVLALAAQRAEPGDFLYPVREVVDWVTDSPPRDSSAATGVHPYGVDEQRGETDVRDGDANTDLVPPADRDASHDDRHRDSVESPHDSAHRDVAEEEPTHRDSLPDEEPADDRPPDRRSP